MKIQADRIDPDAGKVVEKLQRHGYKAYLVGGCVRDLLLDRSPKDFDIATNATPRQIKQLFRNCRIIGKRFRLAHIYFGEKIIETSTFRASPRHDPNEVTRELLIRRDNVFGSEDEDARRRDFTINGLFYDMISGRLIDHVGGLQDLAERTVHTIGDPDIRFQEDPVRMLRAIKFAARLDFLIGETTLAAIVRHKSEISKCASPRVLEEIYRLLRGKSARRSFELLSHTGILAVLSTQLGWGYGNRFAGTELPTRAPSHDDSSPDWSEIWTSPGQPVPPVADAETEWDEDTADQELPFELMQQAETSRQTAWHLLTQLDNATAAGIECSNALLMASLCGPFLHASLAVPGLRPPEMTEIINHWLHPVSLQLQVARRDVERCRLLLMLGRGGAHDHGKKRSHVPADLAHELLVYQRLMNAALQRTNLDLNGLGAPGSTPREILPVKAEKKRRRRRGGRRHKRVSSGPSDDGHPAEVAS